MKRHGPSAVSGADRAVPPRRPTSAVQPDLAYYSYHADGFRVARTVDGQLREVGHFVDQGGNNFWGVQVFQYNG